MSNFDDLFNEYFGESNRPSSNDEFMRNLPPEIQNILKTLMQGPKGASKLNLDNPDDVENHSNEDGDYRKETWNTDFGSITRISIRGEMGPHGFKFPFGDNDKPLEEQLEEAIEVEDYEKASEIRDKIKARDEEEKERREKKDRDRVNSVLDAFKKDGDDIKDGKKDDEDRVNFVLDALKEGEDEEKSSDELQKEMIIAISNEDFDRAKEIAKVLKKRGL